MGKEYTCIHPSSLPELGCFNLSSLLRIKSGTVGRMNILGHLRKSVWESWLRESHQDVLTVWKWSEESRGWRGGLDSGREETPGGLLDNRYQSPPVGMGPTVVAGEGVSQKAWLTLYTGLVAQNAKVLLKGRGGEVPSSGDQLGWFLPMLSSSCHLVPGHASSD